MALPQHNNINLVPSRSRGVNNSYQQRSNSSGRAFTPLTIMILTAVPSFLLGSFSSILMGFASRSSGSGIGSDTAADMEQRLRALQQQQQKQSPLSAAEVERLCAPHAGRALENHLEHDAAHQQQAELFPSETMGRFAVAMGAVNKQEFTDLHDLGVPLDRPTAGSEDILLLYNSAMALPNNFGEDHNQIVHLDAKDAVENCEYLNIVLTDHGSRKQCIAIIPQYESYHLQKWMRVEPRSGRLDAKAELQLVSRGHQSNGMDQFEPPDLAKHTRQHWLMLERYFANVDDVLKELKPILQKIAIDNTVIVMVGIAVSR